MHSLSKFIKAKYKQISDLNWFVVSSQNLPKSFFHRFTLTNSVDFSMKQSLQLQLAYGMSSKNNSNSYNDNFTKFNKNPMQIKGFNNNQQVQLRQSNKQAQEDTSNTTALEEQFQFLQEDKKKLAIMKIDQLSLQWYINIFYKKFHQKIPHPDTTSKSSQQFRKKILSIKQYNQALVNGKDFQQYPLQKLLQICLKSLSANQSQSKQNNSNSSKGSQHQQINGNGRIKQSSELSYMEWQLMQKLFQKRLYRCSLKQYMRVLYICLQSYSTYRFERNFIKGLLIGFRKQIPLMDQTQIMQLFYILSDRIRPSYNILGKYQKDPTRVNIYKSQMIQKLQNQILDKIVQKYTQRYSQKHRNILISEQDMQKLVFWTKYLYLFKSDKGASEQLKQKNQKNMKEEYLIKFLEILVFQLKKKTQNFNEQKKEVPSTFLTGQQIKYSFFGELVEVLTYSHKILKNRLVNMNMITNTFNEIVSPQFQSLKTLKLQIQYLVEALFRDNKQMINQQLKFHFQKHSIDQLSYGKIYNDLKILRFAIQHNIFKECADEKICNKLFENANVVLHMNKSKKAKSQPGSFQSKKSQINSEVQDIQLCQNVFVIVYYLWNRKLLDDSEYSYFYSNILSSQFKNQRNFSMFSPGMIRKLINIEYVQYFNHIQFSQFQKINHDTSRTYRQKINLFNLEKILKNVFRNKHFIIKFSKKMLSSSSAQTQQQQKDNTNTNENGSSKNYNNQQKYNLYVRELEWPLYNYLKLLHVTINKFLKVELLSNPSQGQYLESNESIREYQVLDKQILQILNFMTERNIQISRWLKVKSQDTQFKNFVLPHNMIVTKIDETFNEEISRLGTWIRKAMENEKKQFEMKKQILEIKKFFIQVQTFDVDFGLPVTPFNVVSQFSKVNNHFQRTILLNFMDKEALNKKSKDAIRLMFEVNGFSFSFIDIQMFLKMHINERVEYLMKNIFPDMQECLKFKMKLQDKDRDAVKENTKSNQEQNQKKPTN